jgi:O-antigen/teichoic acid export membrane protein
MFSLFTDLGLNAITSREIAKRPDAASQIISDNMAFRLALCCVTIPVVAGLGLLVYPHQSRQLHVCIALFALDLLLDSVRSVALTFYTSRARNDVVAGVMTGNQLAFLAFAIFALHEGWGVRGIVVAYLTADLLGAVVSVAMVRRRISISLRVRPRQWRIVAAISFPLGIIQVVNMLYFKADSILISVIQGPISVGYYGVAYAVIAALLGVPSLIMSPLMPSMATTSDLRPIVQRAFDTMVMLALPMGVAGFLLRKQIVVAVSSRQYLPAALPFGILVIASVFTYVNNVFGFASVAADSHRRLVRVSIGSLVVNVALNLALIPHWGIRGAAVATAVTEAGAAALTFRVFTATTRIPVRVISPSWRPLAASVLLIPADLLLRGVWSSVHGALGVVVAVAVLGSIYLVVLTVIGGAPPEVAALWSSEKGPQSRHRGPREPRHGRHHRTPPAKTPKTEVEPTSERG